MGAEIPEAGEWNWMPQRDKNERIASISDSLKLMEEDDRGSAPKYPSFGSNHSVDSNALMEFVAEVITATHTHSNVIEEGLYP